MATENRPEVKIDWRIYTKNPNNPLIRDLIIEGLSLARTQKEEFASILNSNDGEYNALFKTVKRIFKKLNAIIILKWWARQDSNLGPIHYECTALTN